jgi:hypothetical protein
VCFGYWIESVQDATIESWPMMAVRENTQDVRGQVSNHEHLGLPFALGYLRANGGKAHYHDFA